MSNFPWLTVAGAIPLVGALVVGLTPAGPLQAVTPTGGRATCWSSGIALVFTLITLGVTRRHGGARSGPAGRAFQFTQIYVSGSRSSACITRSAWTASRWC